MMENEKLKECYNRSAVVVDLYIELDGVYDYLDYNNPMYNDLIRRFKEAIELEDEAYGNLDLDDIAFALNNLGDSLIYDRVAAKITIQEQIFESYSITTGDTFADIDGSVKFSLEDCVTSKIYIDFYKMIALKIKSLKYGDNLRAFVNELYKLNNYECIGRLFECNLGEKLLIAKKFDILQVESFGFDDIEKMFFDSYNMELKTKGYLEDSIYASVKDLLESYSVINMNGNSPESVYNNLLFTTTLEVMIEHLSKEHLKEVYNYCNNNMYGNKMVLSHIRSIVRNRLNR